MAVRISNQHSVLHAIWCKESNEAWLRPPYVTRLAVDPPEAFALHQ